MSLVEIGILAAVAIVISFIPNRHWRSWLIFGVSSITIYALQPAVALRHFSFWFPTLAVGLVFCTWLGRSSGRFILFPAKIGLRSSLTLVLVLGIDLSGRLPLTAWLVNGSSPSPGTVLAGLLGLAGAGWLILRSAERTAGRAVGHRLEHHRAFHCPEMGPGGHRPQPGVEGLDRSIHGAWPPASISPGLGIPISPFVFYMSSVTGRLGGSPSWVFETLQFMSSSFRLWSQVRSIASSASKKISKWLADLV